MSGNITVSTILGLVEIQNFNNNNKKKKDYNQIYNIQEHPVRKNPAPD